MEKKKGLKNKIDSYFKISSRKSSVKIEIFAGITTFLAMAYILIVNPNNILLNGTSDPRFASVFIATAIGSVIGTLLMAFLAKMPLAQAPGMGINAMVGTIIGGSMGFAYSYGNAMAIILGSGIFFLVISFIPAGRDENNNMISLRERIFGGLPKPVKMSISVGLGLFIAFVGMQNAHIISSNQFTLVQLIDFNNPVLWAKGGDACCAVVALFGLMVIGILDHYKVKGSIIIGIISATVLAIPLGVADLNVLSGNVPGISWKFWENIGSYFSGDPNKTVFLSLFNGGFKFPDNSLLTTIMLLITFCMLDLFDTMGTIVGCCTKANLVDDEGNPLNLGKIMYSDSLAALSSSFLGTSAVTVFVESSAGVSVGGKTGLTALTTAFLFLLSIFLLPLFAFIPSAAAASALIYVGVLMMSNVLNLDFVNPKNSIPTFMTIIVMLLAYSITDGIGMGLLTFFVLDISIFFIDLFRYKTGRSKKKPTTELTFVTLVVIILFLIYFLVPTII